MPARKLTCTVVVVSAGDRRGDNDGRSGGCRHPVSPVHSQAVLRVRSSHPACPTKQFVAATELNTSRLAKEEQEYLGMGFNNFNSAIRGLLNNPSPKGAQAFTSQTDHALFGLIYCNSMATRSFMAAERQALITFLQQLRTPASPYAEPRS
jgi:hypothetical protein